jgi:hypothetical protein
MAAKLICNRGRLERVEHLVGSSGKASAIDVLPCGRIKPGGLCGQEPTDACWTAAVLANREVVADERDNRMLTDYLHAHR